MALDRPVSSPYILSFSRQLLMIGSHKQSMLSITSQAVSIALLNHDVYTASNSNPWSFSSLPAALASSTPSTASGTSSQPVNRPSLLFSVFPCLIITITDELLWIGTSPMPGTFRAAGRGSMLIHGLSLYRFTTVGSTSSPTAAYSSLLGSDSNLGRSGSKYSPSSTSAMPSSQTLSISTSVNFPSVPSSSSSSDSSTNCWAHVCTFRSASNFDKELCKGFKP
mmetsp:Transcript_11244/g.16112  ORF Transcript_11244/g.16112 Transcript_11244/m.16112 type:complete len:223 (+) Transcript_11244:680-1348(+)